MSSAQQPSLPSYPQSQTHSLSTPPQINSNISPNISSNRSNGSLAFNQSNIRHSMQSVQNKTQQSSSLQVRANTNQSTALTFEEEDSQVQPLSISGHNNIRANKIPLSSLQAEQQLGQIPQSNASLWQSLINSLWGCLASPTLIRSYRAQNSHNAIEHTHPSTSHFCRDHQSQYLRGNNLASHALSTSSSILSSLSSSIISYLSSTKLNNHILDEQEFNNLYQQKTATPYSPLKHHQSNLQGHSSLSDQSDDSDDGDQENGKDTSLLKPHDGSTVASSFNTLPSSFSNITNLPSNSHMTSVDPPLYISHKSTTQNKQLTAAEPKIVQSTIGQSRQEPLSQQSSQIDPTTLLFEQKSAQLQSILETDFSQSSTCNLVYEHKQHVSAQEEKPRSLSEQYSIKIYAMQADKPVRHANSRRNVFSWEIMVFNVTLSTYLQKGANKDLFAVWTRPHPIKNDSQCLQDNSLQVLSKKYPKVLVVQPQLLTVCGKSCVRHAEAKELEDCWFSVEPQGLDEAWLNLYGVSVQEISANNRGSPNKGIVGSNYLSVKGYIDVEIKATISATLLRQPATKQIRAYLERLIGLLVAQQAI